MRGGGELTELLVLMVSTQSVDVETGEHGAKEKGRQQQNRSREKEKHLPFLIQAYSL